MNGLVRDGHSGTGTHPDSTAGPGPGHVDGRPGSRSTWREVGLIAGREMAVQLRRRELWGSLLITVVVLVGVMGLQQLFSGASSTYRVGVAGDQPAVTAGLAAQQEVSIEVVAVPADADPAAVLTADDLDAVWTPDGRVLVPDTPAGALVEPLQRVHSGSGLVTNLVDVGVDPTVVDRAVSVPPLQVISLDPGAAVAQQLMLTAVIGVLVLFFLMFMYGQAIAQGVLEEKSSRIVEVLLAKVRAWQLLTGKVLGVGTVVLTQMVVILVAGIGAAIAFGVVTEPGELIRIGALVLLWFVPGYLLFATLWAVAGALVSRPEDLNHAAGPVSLIQTLGLFAALVPFVGMNDTLTRVLSLVPGTSWAVMPVRMAAGSVPAWEIVLSLLLMVAAVGALLRIGGRIYLGGVLEHGGPVRARTALRNAKERGLS